MIDEVALDIRYDTVDDNGGLAAIVTGQRQALETAQTQSKAQLAILALLLEGQPRKAHLEQTSEIEPLRAAADAEATLGTSV
jgi:hypothetical protein